MTATTRPIATPVTAELLHGAIELEPTAVGVRVHRLPAWARAQARDPQLDLAQSRPSGVRVAFTTTATSIELRALPTRFTYRGMPQPPVGVIDLVVDGALAGQASFESATVITMDTTTGLYETSVAEPSGVVFDDLAPTEKRVELWLPHNESLELEAVLTDSAVTPSSPRGARWLHHGSSISQGSNATHPTGIWPVVAATRSRVNLTNLGFGGSALLDPFVARTMRDTPADLISLKIGINIVNVDLMRLRAFRASVHGFLDTIREGHPTTPLLVVSPIFCEIHENTPGPGAFDTAALAEGRLSFVATGDPADVAAGRLTLVVIRDELKRIVDERASADENLHYLDGLELYGASDAQELPMPDALHPDAATHERIGERFAARVFGDTGAFSGAPS